MTVLVVLVCWMIGSAALCLLGLVLDAIDGLSDSRLRVSPCRLVQSRRLSDLRRLLTRRRPPEHHGPDDPPVSYYGALSIPSVPLLRALVSAEPDTSAFLGGFQIVLYVALAVIAVVAVLAFIRKVFGI